jgi:hypothetical protein
MLRCKYQEDYGFEISCPDISAVTGMTAPFFFLFFTTTHLNLNHNFYSETPVLVLGIALRIYVHSAL